MFKNITNNRSFLPVAILLLIIFILIFAALRISLGAGAAPVPTPTQMALNVVLTPSPTQSPTDTSTVTLTPRPTWTLRPSSTSTVTPTPTWTGTPTPVALLTPAKPLKFNDLYRLRTWTPADAAAAVQQMQDFPDNQFYDATQRLNPLYDADFGYPAVAIQEMLLRFPNHPNAEQWRWWLAYDLARIDDPRSGAQYASLITSALNSRQVILSDLPGWFSQKEFRLSLKTDPLTPDPGYLSSQVIEIKANGGGGGVYLWLLESPNGFQAHVLASHFDFADQIEANFSVGDLTGDGKNEVVVYYSPAKGSYEFTPPQVSSLSVVPPPVLNFVPTFPLDFGIEYKNEWSIQEKDLQFNGLLFPSCPVQISRTYHWNGEYLAFDKTLFQVSPDLSLLAYCELVVNQSATFWGPQATLQIMQAISPVWPPATDTQGKPYPADAKDEWRYRIGLLKALSGDQTGAESDLKDLISKPSVMNSQWVKPAQQFLEADKTPQDIYRACLPAVDCDPRLALAQAVRTIPPDDYSKITTDLERLGVVIRSSGVFDFENDGDPERWILVRHHPIDKLEFWILAHAPGGIRALFVDTSDSDNPAPHFHEPMDTPPVVQIIMHTGFILNRLPTTKEPYITHVEVEFIPTTYTRDTLQTAMQALFSGENPQNVLDTLVKLQDSGRFNCLNYRICDRFYYILGLAYELSAHPKEAIDAYIQLWWENINSPYTLLARMKLEVIPYATFTPTGTKTSTITPTPNPNATKTPTPTITNTINPNETTTITPTATITPTPTETPEDYPPP